MKLPPIVLFLAKLALPVLLGSLWAYRRYLEKRPPRPRGDEVAFERPYERIEPVSGQPDYVRGASDFILRSHEWVALGLLVATIGIGIVAIREPMVRIVMGITAVVLVAIVIPWGSRRRAANRSLPAEMVRSQPRPAQAEPGNSGRRPLEPP